MNASDVFGIGYQALMVALEIGAPVMLMALGIGMIISILQALTQIQEMTLTFVPKILVIFVSLLVLMPFMLSTLVEFTQSLFARIVTG